jgi:transposase
VSVSTRSDLRSLSGEAQAAIRERAVRALIGGMSHREAARVFGVEREGDGRRRWRAMDLGTSYCCLEAWAPRVNCKRHAVVVAAVPWARHDASFTRPFEDQVAWLAVHTSKTAVSDLMRIAWRSVGWICRRVMAEQSAKRDLFAGL